MKFDLFISYSTSDGLELANLIGETLKKKYLLDIYLADRETKTGESIDEKVREAITQSRRFLVLFTDDTLNSDWVKAEIHFAQTLGKNIIICKANTVNNQHIPILLQAKEQIVFSQPDDLLRSLEKIEWGIPLIIPAAGKSGGLYPLNLGMPKILLPIGDKPILHYIIDKLDARVFSKVIILTGDFSTMVEYYASLIKTEIPIKCERTKDEDKLPVALKSLSLETTFMIHYSDIIIEGDFNWADFIEHHKTYRKRSNVIGTLMASNRYKLPVGKIRKGENQSLKDFTEKPESIESFDYSINMAVSIFEPEFLDSISDDDISFYGDSLQKARESGKPFCIYDHDKWRHIQTLSDWYEAQQSYFPDAGKYQLKDITSHE